MGIYTRRLFRSFPDTTVIDFVITSQISFQIFYEESKTSMSIGKQQGRKRAGKDGGEEERRRGRGSASVLYTLF